MELLSKVTHYKRLNMKFILFFFHLCFKGFLIILTTLQNTLAPSVCQNNYSGLSFSKLPTPRSRKDSKSGSTQRGCSTNNRSSNEAVITEECRVFRLFSAARHRRGPANAVKSSQQQYRALWVVSNRRGLPLLNSNYASGDVEWRVDLLRAGVKQQF